MSRVTDRLRRAARKVGAKTEAAVKKAEKRVARAVRKRQDGRGKLAEVIAVAGAAAVTGAVVDEAARRLSRRGAKVQAARPLAFEVPLPVGAETAIARVTDALRAEGFGVLTRIDAHTTFREKLGVDFRAYTILGACNPSLALRALTASPEAGMLLPCNVTVEAGRDGGSVVRIVNPIAMLEGTALGGDAALRAVATDAEHGLARAAEWLKEHGHATVL